ncbi:hypothetical protein HDU93_010006 [Gonapodya sp. JEL0774]|nr:hypothetical protein HDU93_010006 [Gonapodya sp. JEL0774]
MQMSCLYLEDPVSALLDHLIPFVSCAVDPAYNACVSAVRRDMVTATAAINALSTVLMGIGANLPFALAPGLGASAYFTFTVVGFHGSGSTKYGDALGAICLEGIIFAILSILGVRQWLARHIPDTIKTATTGGIGFFLTFIGLQKSAGVAMIVADSATLVALGGCPLGDIDSAGFCNGNQMRSPTLWIGILGFFIIILGMAYKVKGSILIGVLFVGLLSWIPNTPFTYFPNTTDGQDRFSYFKKGVDFHVMDTVPGSIRFNLASDKVWGALVAFLFVDILDTTGCLFSMARYAGLMNSRGNFPGDYAAFIIDATCIAIGAPLGTSPVTVYIESGAGLQEGGRTGLTAVTTGIMFFLSLFFAPIFASLPPWASGPALVAVGSMMMPEVTHCNWKYIGMGLLSVEFLFMVIHGAGLFSFIAINGAIFIIEKASGGRITTDQTDRQPWRQEGDDNFILPDWAVRRLYGKKDKDVDSLDIKQVPSEAVPSEMGTIIVADELAETAPAKV